MKNYNELKIKRLTTYAFKVSFDMRSSALKNDIHEQSYMIFYFTTVKKYFE